MNLSKQIDERVMSGPGARPDPGTAQYRRTLVKAGARIAVVELLRRLPEKETQVRQLAVQLLGEIDGSAPAAASKSIRPSDAVVYQNVMLNRRRR